MSRLTIPQATDRQRKAADPSEPRIVNANAGSGKTKVLVDRVSRILLQGTDPDKILCITYTRAAASEMQERLYRKLSEWSVASDETLKAELERLHGCPFDQLHPALQLETVRTLFARALETPEGLKVMTIHAFCERIIQRFPIEAGIMPGFEPLDDRQTRQLLSDSRATLLAQARTDETIAKALHHMAAAKADVTIDGLIYGSARHHDRTLRWQAHGGVAPFRKAVGLAANERAETIAADAWRSTDQDHLKRIAVLCEGQTAKAAKEFVKTVEKLFTLDDPAKAFSDYSQIFLTQKDKPRARILVKAVTDIDPFISVDSPEMQRVIEVTERIKAVRIAEMSEALLVLSLALGEIYQGEKHRARGLDFNDLILMTRNLLKRRDVSDWVTYKLDGGIEHVLLDEAQDTSPEQWEIIDAVTDAFAQDSPDRDRPRRTFFAVGDPKQSIYGFQGAAPEIFMDSVRTRTAPGDRPVDMRMSFRSAQQVLDVVDHLFVDQGGVLAMFDAEALPEPSDRVRHDAARDDPGLVELWPLAPKAEAIADREPWDTTPVDAQGEGDPRVRLAQTIATTIADWIETGEPVFDRERKHHRPMHAGDILILVQKRVGGLFDAIIKALKTQGLPVAGADRLVLQDALIIRDLLALTRFVLLPQDDLSLAETLKSPLFGLDDDALFTLCVDRRGTLWEAVQTRDPSIAASLSEILSDSDRTPYDFYARLLDRRGPRGKTYREALFRRLGMESREALEAFLSVALAHQQHEAPSLQRFLQSFTADAIEIKRDKDPAGREVRVMTVHGAKGLEAPVVFLPDTTRAPRPGVSGLIKADDSWILAPSSKDSIPLVDQYKAEEEARERREYMRLLYVAMTRAESRLILCGHHHGNSKTGYQEGSWYDWLQRTMEAMPNRDMWMAPFSNELAKGLRYGQKLSPSTETGPDEAALESPLPVWIDKLVDAPLRQQSASPSQLLPYGEPPDRTPGADRFVRGLLIHRLLEILPDHPRTRRQTIADAMLRDYKDITEEQSNAIKTEVFSVLDDPTLTDVFADGSRAEVALAGRADTIRNGDIVINAQVDRLSVTEDRVYLIDYKSNRDVPDRDKDIDAAYLAQMAAYRELSRAIWPDKEVRCGLLWTTVPKLTWLHDNAMDAALTDVNTLPTS